MYKLTDIKDIRFLQKKYNFSFNKGFGQNFLTDEDVLNSIVEHASITKNSMVVEIGPGFGTLTQKLCENAGKVCAIEIDNRLIPVLNETLSDYNNVEVINCDFLKMNFSKLIEENKNNYDISVAANLPYYITTPILMELLFKKYNISKIVVMVQKEVAERMTALPKTKNYGALSVAVQYFCTARLAFTVPASSFEPAPNVDSAVVVLDVLKNPSVNPKSEDMFFKVVKASFAQRRKTLKNGLSNSGFFKMSKNELGELIKKVANSENVRGEELTLQQFCEISNEIY